MRIRWLLVGLLAVGLAGCAADQDDNVREYDLVAEVVDWTVVDGEVVEVWGYNGEYPGPAIEAEVGDTVRVNFTNNLPEGTTIHWHGLEVPNDQDGVPGITQPMIEPGQSWTYEFTVDRPGTTMYHTHANTVKQLGRGLVGPFVVREKAAQRNPKYDGEYTMVLHEIDGLFTINGRSFPNILEDPESVVAVETGDRVLLRLINAGQQHHPMHLHGHQITVVALDSNPVEVPYRVNTVDIAPGQTVDVEVVADNPGTWTFHCHILPHVTNRGEYPGGMLTLVEYTDHTSYLEGAPAPEPTTAGEATTTTAAPVTDEPPAASEVLVAATEFAFSPATIVATAGDELTIRLRNDGAVVHNLEVVGLDLVVEAEPGQTADLTFTVPAEPGEVALICNIPGHREAGMEGVLRIDSG